MPSATKKKKFMKDCSGKKIDTCRLKAFGILSMIWLAFFVKSELELKNKS